MNFGSYKSEWADQLARALAAMSCENPIEISHGEWENCGDHPLSDKLCPPCDARRFVAMYPREKM